MPPYQYWQYHWYHRPTNQSGIETTKREMNAIQFLSSLAKWNMGVDGDYVYTPVFNQPGIISPPPNTNTE